MADVKKKVVRNLCVGSRQPNSPRRCSIVPRARIKKLKAIDNLIKKIFKKYFFFMREGIAYHLSHHGLIDK
jgi:hypothetical protein